MIHIETKRLIVRNYRTTDFNDVFSYFSSEEVCRYEDFYPMTEKQVENIISEWKDMDNRLVAELKSKNIVIGGIGYWTDDEGHHCLDYDFNPHYGGHGYTACHGVMDERQITDYKYGAITYVGSYLKKVVKIPVIVVDQIATIQRGNQLLEENACDFVAYARPFLVDSSFVVKSRNNENYKPCLGCKTCQWFSNADKCPVYNKESTN